eukprot:7723029-Lingulodinium_polyedra.AAC.1
MLAALRRLIDGESAPPPEPTDMPRVLDVLFPAFKEAARQARQPRRHARAGRCPAPTKPA